MLRIRVVVQLDGQWANVRVPLVVVVDHEELIFDMHGSLTG